MAIADRLFQEAQQIAAHQQSGVLGLEEQIRDLEAQLIQKKAALDSARLEVQRLGRFVPQIATNYYCPRCFIEDKRLAVMHPIGGDIICCGACNREISAV